MYLWWKMVLLSSRFPKNHFLSLIYLTMTRRKRPVFKAAWPLDPCSVYHSTAGSLKLQLFLLYFGSCYNSLGFVIGFPVNQRWCESAILKFVLIIYFKQKKQ
jgi:hypothetical protein